MATLRKAVKHVKIALKDKGNNEKPLKKKLVEKNEETTTPKRNDKKLFPREFKSTRGVVYVGHIPHGFYEEEMKGFFSQFGKVTKVRVARSKKTGRSRSYGYVEFLRPEVAKIAAETMNNYLMFGRLLKTTYIEPEKQHFGLFVRKNWSRLTCPGRLNRLRVSNIRNSKITTEKHNSYVESTKNKLQELQKKLKKHNIDMDLNAIISET
ncbi:MKI67 FHA domain-interacting nucleolar phosphoprotein-like [Prorops nasuta]|uniref:MKI67 FHA domain-interacting nucleolar phosphoprotein-like n=1 Tax=Prorops nasuta TaxID=863751 RepID=UPI0034CF0FE8